MKRIYLGVGLVTLATLLVELILTRIFSVTLYYHFAFMVISIALFGLGLSGVSLFLRAERHSREVLSEQLSSYSRRFAVALVVALAYAINHSISMPTDPLHAQAFSWQNFFELTFLYLVCAVPFYYGGMVVSLALHHLHEKVATIYFFDLVGASLACLILDPLLGLLGGPNAVLVGAILVSFAAVIFGREETRWVRQRSSLALAAVLVLLLIVNLGAGIFRVGSFKAVDNRFLAFSKWNAISRIEVQERPGMPPDLTIDAQARTIIMEGWMLKATKAKGVFPDNISTLVHVARPGGRMLIIGPGGGVDVANALVRGKKEIHLAEINPIILYDVMLGRYKKRSGNLYGRKEVHPHLAEGRNFVRRTKLKFDIIQASLVDTWAATASGAFSLTENHLYTVEAFEDYIRALKPGGMVTMTRWVGVPGMEFLRLAALARAALEGLGVKRPQYNVFAAFQGKLGTIIVKRTSFTPKEAGALVSQCKKRGFSVLYTPGQRFNNPLWHILGSKDPSEFFRRFEVDVRPVHDDRPFFFQAIKPERVFSDLLRWRDTGNNSFSLQVIFAMLVLVLLLVVSTIVVPLWLKKRQHLLGGTGSKLRDLSYFMALGVGFIFIEISLLQRFTLVLGHPITSLRVVLFGMLFFSGLGSLLSSRVQTPGRLRLLMVVAAASTAILSLAYGIFLGDVVQAAVGWSLAMRIGVSLGLVAAPALLMGTLLPTGLRLVATRHAEIVPWAWGLNGAASVLGSVLAMFLAIFLGFSKVLIIGGAMYLVALLLGLRRGAPRDEAG